ncbi:hypothetical protein P280DRAFT_540606 [Massarina eburnea CBS 473.64]|uniref:Rhodopsin domain-containing protein n=1 Tax=Massarina eburnea CBS 473.64 TaxID=1395130 RepID=A0A6A6S950_9PLEO|nr:hypothetical protein P280DRAFT_540606 [Massarina eburnea CBS 473.64]
MTLDDNPRGVQAIAISSAFSGVALAVILMRLYTRLFIVHCAGVEDYFVTFAMMCSMGLTVTIAIQAMCGMGQHFAELKSDNMQHSLEAFYASLLVYNLSLGLIKTSILLQYRRVFTTRRFQVVCWLVLTAVVIHTTWSVLGSILACLPVRAFWTKETPAKCIDQFSMWFTNAGINITTDFIIILLPIPVIKSLNLAKRQKLALMGIFAVGGL